MIRLPELFSRTITKDGLIADVLIDPDEVNQPDTKATSTEPKRQYGCLMIDFDLVMASRIRKLGEMIDPEDLAEDGVEDHPHITVLYGIETTEDRLVRNAIGVFPTFDVQLMKTSVFEASDIDAQRGGCNHDVLKVDVVSPELMNLNTKLRNSLAHVSTFPTYVPHVTIAYLKRGCGRKYAGLDVMTSVRVMSLEFSNKFKVKRFIPLTGDDGKPVTGFALAPICPYCGSRETHHARATPYNATCLNCRSGFTDESYGSETKSVEGMSSLSLADGGGLINGTKTKSFDPNESRDGHGRWTSSGGAGQVSEHANRILSQHGLKPADVDGNEITVDGYEFTEKELGDLTEAHEHAERSNKVFQKHGSKDVAKVNHEDGSFSRSHDADNVEDADKNSDRANAVFERLGINDRATIKDVGNGEYESSHDADELEEAASHVAGANQIFQKYGLNASATIKKQKGGGYESTVDFEDLSGASDDVDQANKVLSSISNSPVATLKKESGSYVSSIDPDEAAEHAHAVSSINKKLESFGLEPTVGLKLSGGELAPTHDLDTIAEALKTLRTFRTMKSINNRDIRRLRILSDFGLPKFRSKSEIKSWDGSKHPRGHEGNSGQFSEVQHAEVEKEKQESEKKQPELPSVSHGQSPTSFLNDVTPQQFLEARDKSSKSPFLSQIEAADLEGHKLILTADGKAGAAVSPEGDIQNVFNNGGPKGVGQDIMIEAIKNGGKTLDCYHGYLPGYYSNFGFTEVGRMKFDRQYAPDGWDYDEYGEPDIVFMARTEKGSEDEYRSRFAKWSEPKPRLREQPEPGNRIYEGSQWDQAKSDSRRVGDGSGLGKGERPSTNRSGDSDGTRRVQGGGRGDLTESPEFKKWFGDWEKDPSQSSKVVDKSGRPQETTEFDGSYSKVMRNGKPVSVYHGTGKGGFTEFDKQFLGRATTTGNTDELLYGPGFYFTEDPDVAKDYSKIGESERYSTTLNRDQLKELAEKTRSALSAEYQAWIASGMEEDAKHIKSALENTTELHKRMNNPGLDIEKDQDALRAMRAYAQIAEVDHKGIDKSMTGEVKNVFLNIRKPFDIETGRVPLTDALKADYNAYFKSFQEMIDANPKGPNAKWAREEMASYRDKFDNGIDYASALGMFASSKHPKQDLNDYLVGHGYDGITHIGGVVTGGKKHRVWIAFEPNQIKSTDNIGSFDPRNPSIMKSAL